MSYCLINYDSTCHSLNKQDQNPNGVLTSVIANSGEEEEIYPLTIAKIADAQRADKVIRKIFKPKRDKTLSQQFQVSIVEDIKVLTDSQLKLIIPKPLRKRDI